MSIEAEVKKTLNKELTVRYTGSKNDLIACGLATPSMFPLKGKTSSGIDKNLGRYWSGLKSNNQWEIEYYPIADEVLSKQDNSDALRAFANRL